MDRELFLANIIKYCQINGISAAKACENAGIGKNYVTNIRRGQWPSIASVYALAQYLNCTVSDLVGDNKEKIEKNKLFGDLFSALMGEATPEQQFLIKKMLEAKKEEQK